MSISKFSEDDLTPVRTVTYTENEAALIAMVHELIHHGEQDSLEYKHFEKARKLVWKIKTEKERPVSHGENLYDLLS